MLMRERNRLVTLKLRLPLVGSLDPPVQVLQVVVICDPLSDAERRK